MINTGNSNEFIVNEKDIEKDDPNCDLNNTNDTGDKVMEATMLQDCLRSTSFQVAKESTDVAAI